MLNRKLLVAGAVLSALWLAGRSFASAMPLLLVAACPLSMVLMMRRMGTARHEPAGPDVEAATSGRSDRAPESTGDELRELRGEVNRLRAKLALPAPKPGPGIETAARGAKYWPRTIMTTRAATKASYSWVAPAGQRRAYGKAISREAGRR